jgi:hypothetical protein
VIAHNSRLSSFPHKWIVIGILFVSLLSRWLLIFRGGQYYNSDETRYEVSLAAARLLWQGQVGEALRQLTISPEHLGFKAIGILPALTEHLIGPSLMLPAIFFSFFSVLNLYLIFLLSRRSQSSPNEPVYALFFAASCLSLLYYSRHLFPYDMAMSFGLMALYTALDRDPTTRTSFVCGLFSFLCFITYNGYWPLAGLALLMHVLMQNKQISSLLQKAMPTALGFVIPLLLLFLAMRWSGTDMISAYRLFATSITQGVFEEGWSIPLEYFWYTEHIIILILGALAILALIDASKDQKKYTRLWAGGILFIYLCLVIPSLLDYFVVYARLARQLLPLLILLAAQGLFELEKRTGSGARVTGIILAITFLQGTWNFYAAYRVDFPRDFAAEVQTQFPDFEFSSKRLAFGAPVVCQDNGYVIEHTKFYVAPPEELPHVEGRLLLSALHPTNYQPYLYEGDPPEFRLAYRNLKLKMSFYKTDQEFMSETNPTWAAIESCVTAED